MFVSTLHLLFAHSQQYVAEAANPRRFSELYAQNVAIADVFVPKVYAELTTRKVLTMEWVDGFRFTDNKKLGDTLVQWSLRQITEMDSFMQSKFCLCQSKILSSSHTSMTNPFNYVHSSVLMPEIYYRQKTVDCDR